MRFALESSLVSSALKLASRKLKHAIAYRSIDPARNAGRLVRSLRCRNQTKWTCALRHPASRFTSGRSSMRRFWHSYAALLLVFAFVPLLHAQQTINNASLSGRVTDPVGAVVQAAHVTTRQVATNIVRSTSTDAEGRFRFPYLAVGVYEVIIEDAGFANATRSVTLTVGRTSTCP
jgi:hypothetical protein